MVCTCTNVRQQYAMQTSYYAEPYLVPVVQSYIIIAVQQYRGTYIYVEPKKHEKWTGRMQGMNEPAGSYAHTCVHHGPLCIPGMPGMYT